MSRKPPDDTVDEPRPAGRVLVVGAGVAGIRAAIDLAEVGCHVTLLESSSAIGGILAKLDRQFPNDHCGMCRMLPEVGRIDASRFCLRKGLSHDRIDILTDGTWTALRGEPGDFQATIRLQPHMVNAERCAGCDRPCIDACPIVVPDPFNHGLTHRKAIGVPSPFHPPDDLRIDADACNRCGECVAVCPVGAIDLDAAAETVTLDADAVIVAVGSEMHRPSDDPATRHLCVSRDVVTALDFERMLGVAGPRRRSLLRPSDGRAIERIAWLQCVGSRDRKHGRDVCSTVCCMFALKQARIVREIGSGDVEASIFYMDLRGLGKGFQRNRDQAERVGVHLVRSRVREVTPAHGGGVHLRYFDETTGTMQRTHADLLVLSTGQVANPRLEAVGRVAGWRSLDEGYAPAQPLDKVRSPTPGVFLAGSVTGPTDIAESVTSATAAAGQAARMLVSLGREVGPPGSRGPEKHVDGDESRVLVILCHCHHPSKPSAATVESLQAIPGLDVQLVSSPCRRPGADEVRAILERTNHQRLVFAACFPHVYHRSLASLARRAGFDPNLVRVVDARHSSEPARMAASALRSVTIPRPVSLPEGKVPRRVLVVGGGLAGMRAALSLAHHDVEVHLVERGPDLGGVTRTHQGPDRESDSRHALAVQMRQRVRADEHIIVYTRARVADSRSDPGRQDTLIRARGARDVRVRHGATILATGGHEASTTSFGFGTSDRILTQSGFEQLLRDAAIGADALGAVVMIQCVDSRRPGAHRYCSRLCCPRALRNAMVVRERNPDAFVLVAYRDMMACGRQERDFTEARRHGVVFATYDPSQEPSVEVAEGRPVVTLRDRVLGRPLQVKADWLVLSTAIEPEADNEQLANAFGVDLDEDGFFEPVDPKWRPVDARRDGVFLAGTGRLPQPSREAIAEGEAAAQRAFDRLGRPVTPSVHAVARVHHALCAKCGRCVEACPFDARTMDNEVSEVVVDPLGCRACGLCTVACPNGATRLGATGQEQIMEALDTALEDVGIAKRKRREGSV